MLKKWILSVCLILLNFIAMAQFSVDGTYRYTKQELVASFTFSNGNQFNFFYSYGAADRYASGTYTIEGNIIKLKSDKEPGNDFTVIHAEQKGRGYRIQFEHREKLLLNHIRCLVFAGEHRHEFFTNEEGIVEISLDTSDKIYAQHALFPDVVTLIKDEGNTNKQFTVSLNPSLQQVSFKGIDLTIEDDETLSCLPNYFMMMEGIRFFKVDKD